MWEVAALTAILISALIAEADPRLPSLTPQPPYVGSETCRSCHPREHASWHRSFHRTMTQVATPETVAGKFDGPSILSDGLLYKVYTDDHQLMAEMPDPDIMMYAVQGGRNIPFSEIPRVKRPVVLATGSHHYQTYWVASQRYEGLLQTLPLVYLLEDKRWVPREEAFMRGPDDRGRLITQWNHHCIRCHSTGGNPGLNEAGMLKSKVAELGIACEACHGPGQKHVQFRTAEKKNEPKGEANDPIVNPARLDHRRSSQVCGQCHGVYIMRDEYAMQSAREGPLYFPGENLHKTRLYMQHPNSNPTPQSAEDFKRNPEFYRERWWDDGTILAGGREYTALAASACYKRGEISCVSCHSMHKGDPVDQLKIGADTAQACTSCHSAPKYTSKITTHTFHPANSEGSNCLNCHMPYTSYALFKGIRSHQISSPNIKASAQFGTPNACNLCHLEKTLAWTQQALQIRYGKPPVELTEEQQNTSAFLLWLLRGNAAQRVIAAWHSGWEPAQKTAGQDWLAPFIAQLLRDPYGVVRYVSARSLHTLPGYRQFEFDFLGKPEYLAERVNAAIRNWVPRTNAQSRAILLDETGLFLTNSVAELLRLRDDRSVTIKE